MPLLPEDSAVGHSYGLEFDGIVIKQIQQCDGLKFEQDVIELKENTSDGRYTIRQLPGRPKAPKITLTRGLTADTSFQDWIKTSQIGKMGQARKGGSIIVYDYEGLPLKRYKLINAWPSSLEISTLKAGDTSVLTEKLTLTCDEMDVE